MSYYHSMQKYKMMSTPTIGLIVIFGVSIIGTLEAQVTLPTQLTPPCELINPIVFVDDYVTGSVEIRDKEGKEVTLVYAGPKVYLKAKDGQELATKPGDIQEQCLLRIMEATYSKMYLHEQSQFASTDAKNQYAIEKQEIDHLIRVIKHRCASKKENSSNF
jgi:hypothetical protein